MSTDGIRLFQFLEANNNQDSVQLFFYSLTSYLDKTRPNWRDTHVVLLDNMTSHKTHGTRRLFESLKIPYLFSAPASFLTLPIESVFKYIKLTDFREKLLAEDVLIKNIRHDQLNHK